MFSTSEKENPGSLLSLIPPRQDQLGQSGGFFEVGGASHSSAFFAQFSFFQNIYLKSLRYSLCQAKENYSKYLDQRRHSLLSTQALASC